MAIHQHVRHSRILQLLCSAKFQHLKNFIRWINRKTKSELCTLYDNHGITFLFHRLSNGHFLLHASFQNVNKSFTQKFTSCNSVDLVMFFTSINMFLKEHSAVVKRVGAFNLPRLTPYRKSKRSTPPALLMLASEAAKKAEVQDVLAEARALHRQQCPEMIAAEHLMWLRST